ncbi:MAG: YqeG family HAD IIIA-type phosphatase [Lachnospiraceae bacterium]|nr:YqeG family HAD IIIA-type phosphatase [Lachnospiraceae bacterium]
MFSMFYPSTYERSAYSIDYGDLYARGYRGLIFDIDNTLVPHDAPATASAALLVRRLKRKGFKVEIVSNNKEPRVKSFALGVGAGYVYKAGKPGSRGYLKAAEKMGLKREAVMVIGDQLFTDIWGANISRMHSILVGRISWKEPPHIHLKRILELPLLIGYFATHKAERKKLWRR